MIYNLNGDEFNLELESQRMELGIFPLIGFLSKGDIDKWNDYLKIDDRIVDECLNGLASKFESHDGFDYISLLVPDKNDILRGESRISIYFRENLLLFICEDNCNYAAIDLIIRKIEANEIKNLSLERILFEFFDVLTSQDTLYLENFEQEISEMEEALMTSKKKDYIKDIILFRKKLLVLKRYYEQLFDLAQAVEENQNELLSAKMLRNFHILTNRANRLADSISNLRDYVSQVREAYQAEVDISQNVIMRIFTVITAIFLPLTLIVGWYGMNFPMPEYKWAYGYPTVIILCLTVALFSFIYFRKNKWF